MTDEWDEQEELTKANRWWRRLPAQTKIDIMYDWGTAGEPHQEPSPSNQLRSR